MQPALIIVLIVATTSVLAATSEPKPGIAGAFVVSETFSPKGHAFMPQYRRAGDALALRAAESCPAGYDKLAERVLGGGDKRKKEPPLQSQVEIDADVAARLPKSICCPKCRKKLVAVKKNPVTRRLDIEIRLTKVPEIVNRDLRLGRMECPACGEKIPVDLAMFGALPSPRH